MEREKERENEAGRQGEREREREREREQQPDRAKGYSPHCEFALGHSNRARRESTQRGHSSIAYRSTAHRIASG
eukprot:69526-Rhodomonas_salina.5